MTCKLIRKARVWQRLFVTSDFEKEYKKVNFERLLKTKCADEVQIGKDIRRTKTPAFLDSVTLEEYQEAVRRVLTAYSNYNPQIGYVQGMNMSASALLANICTDFAHATKWAEEAFRLFLSIMNQTQIGEYCKGNMEGIKGLINELKERIQEFAPKVYWHIVTTDVC